MITQKLVDTGKTVEVGDAESTKPLQSLSHFAEQDIVKQISEDTANEKVNEPLAKV